MSDNYKDSRTLKALVQELSPRGILEQTFADEIMGAASRLHRCRAVEADLSISATLDPMIDELTEKQQKIIDRARTQAHNILRRSLAELRKLQAERETEPGIQPELAACVNKSPAEHVPDHPATPPASPFRKSSQTPRNAPCPCGSRVRYKRCCGKGAPPVLNIAA